MTVADARKLRLFPAALAVPTGLGLAWLLWLTFVQVFLVQWNAPRLAPAAALVRGLEIYGTAESGPFLGWVYGPVFPLVFAAVAWLPDQVSLHGAAWLMNLAVAAGPLWLAARCGGGRGAAGVAVLTGGLLALGTGFGRSSLSFIHVDLLCCGFGTLACLALARGIGGGRAAWVVAAAMASVMAVGTKQVAISLVAGLALWLASTGCRHELGRYLGALVLGGLVAAIAAVLFFGRDELMFNLWTVHQHNPFAPDFAGLLGAQLVALGRELLPLAMVWIVIRPDRPAVVSDPVADRLERALWWVALAHLPLGLLAAVKVAGGLNSVHTFHYLGCLVVVRLARVFAAPGGVERLRRVLLVMAMAVALAQGWYGSRRDGQPIWPPVERLREEEALARREPGGVYFPWNPLVTVLTEDQVRPFDDALLCLDRLGLPADRAAVLGAIPSGVLVVYPDPVQSTFALNFLQGPRL